jgi:energy-coupling factor transporter ATP-binding protein EcfA2
MRLTQIEAHDFLSFSELHLDELDPKLNVIVGPNGAGKSNIVRIVDLLVLALSWSSGREPGERMRKYAEAGRRGSGSERFCVRVGVEVDQDYERDLLIAWLRIALFSTFVGTNQSRAESTDGYLLGAIDRDMVDFLSRGSVVVAFRRLPAERFFVGYEFEVDGQTFCYIMRGDQAGGIVHGRLEEHVWRTGSVQVGSTRSPDRLFVDEELDNSSEQDIGFDFNPGRLLPGEGEFIQLAGQPLFNWQETSTVQEFMRVLGFGIENRTYMLDVVLARLLDEIMIVNECRGLARHLYRASELTVPAELGRADEVPLELLRLKLGSLEQRERFTRTQELFKQLTDAEFDLRLRRVTTPLSRGAAENDGNQEDFSFEIDVEVGAIPLEFSGAGRWEALVLSTALSGDGTIMILDEPAINLHPTLQRRLLSTVRESASQILLITHSPFLVPADGPAEIDIITRVGHADGRTTIHRTRLSKRSTHKEATDASKMQRFMMASSDARALLFANAVLLVEGDTELGALDVWLPAIALDGGLPVPDDLNLVIAAVGSDSAFATYTRYLKAFGIPWIILCDGKASDPNYAHTLCRQLGDLSNDARPGKDDDFEAWCVYWASVGVFSLAESFEEEIEVAFRRADEAVWDDVKEQYGRSKVRGGRAFAQRAKPPERLAKMYPAMVKHLGWANRLVVPGDGSHQA